MMKKMLVESISRERCNPVFVCYGCLVKYLSVYDHKNTIIQHHKNI